MRQVHSTSDPPPDLQLAAEVLPFIPSTFTSVSQISRQVPPTLMDRVATPACGGLRQLLARHPELFETKMIGSVHVARQRLSRRQSAQGLYRRGTSVRRGEDTIMNTKWHAAPGAVSQGESTAQAESSGAVAELQRRFPDFLVPVKALWMTVPEREEADERRRVLTALRDPQQSRWLIFHPHPTHRHTAAVATVPGKERTAQEGKEDAVLENGYVQLRSASLSSPPPAASVPDVHARVADYRIQPYEWYRVARVLPTIAAEVDFNKELYDAAAALLPPGRDIWQVLLSAPHLFTVRYDAPASSPQPSEPRVTVRFLLHHRYVPAGVDGVEEDALLRDLEALAADKEASRCGLSTRQRRHKRRLQQQLTFLRNPTPYFDHRVLVQHLFDLLPMRDGVHQSALLGALPPHAVSAFPQNVTDLLKERSDLFRLSDARHGVLVQRADAPAAEHERTVDSVSGEEILQCLFSSYSTRSDPRSGTTISRNLSRLPRLIRERLFAMQDVVAELLGLYPEKVELLPASSRSGSSQQTQDEYEREQRELQNVRGRRDFLVPFRFVGEWEVKLVERYTQQQEKEMAKRGARPRVTPHRRPRY